MRCGLVYEGKSVLSLGELVQRRVARVSSRMKSLFFPH